MDNPLDPLSWAAQAEEDFALAQSALRRKIPLTYGANFHAQQCIEKYFKAVLLTSHLPFPKTHDLVALSDLCLQAGILLPVDMDDLERLNAYSVLVRYPGNRATVEEVQEAVQLMRTLRRFLQKYLGIAK
ncbi:MAG: HEPN domain-containing protein [Saprospiraceae bacterium]|nr:HEPN domain-containing protein [Saprospiraceae bacterium]